MDRKADAVLQESYGISLSWARLMLTLDSKAGLTQHSIAKKLNHSDPAVSRILVKLEQAKLVNVEVDPYHQRKRLVTLTENGKSILDEAKKKLESLFMSDLEKAGIDIELYISMSDLIEEQLSGEHSQL